MQSIGPFKVRIEHAGVVLGEFVFDKDVILMGRAPECDLRINTNTISRKHAELRRSPTGFSVFAISQTNPTAINEIPVPPKKSLILSEGDVVVLAKKFRIFVELVRSTPAPDGPGAATTNRLEPVAGNLRPGSEGGEDLTEPALDVPLSPAELLRDLDGKDSGKWGAGHEAYAALQDDSPARPKREAPLTQPLSRAELEAPSPAPAPARAPAPATPAPAPAPAPTPPAPWAAVAPQPIEIRELASAPRPRTGPPGARITFELNGETRTLELYDDLLIGGGPDSDVVLQGPYAPRRAALVVRLGRSYRLYNTAPRPESVVVGGKGVEGQVPLSDGDELSIYGIELRFNEL